MSEAAADEQEDDLSSVGSEDQSIYKKGPFNKHRLSETPSTASPSVLSQMDLNDALRQVRNLDMFHILGKYSSFRHNCMSLTYIIT